MSAFPDAPNDLLDWLGAEGRPRDPDAFLPRRDYARYLVQRLAEAETAGRAHGAALTKVHAGVDDAQPRADGLLVVLAGGRSFLAHEVVLALGNLPPADPLAACGGAALPPALYARDPWAPGALEGIPPDGPVLVLGTGLTAIDVTLTLRRLRHRGPVVALSRRGLLPRPQRSPGGTYGGGYDPAPVLAAQGSLRRLVRTVRREARRHAARGGDWRDLVAALRPITPRLWGALPLGDRARFLRHLRPYWDAHRHRMAPAVEDALAGLWAEGLFVERAGRVLDVRAAAGGVEVRWRPRGTPDVERWEVARIVNAVGASLDLRASADPLVAALRARGLLTPDPLGLGLATAPDGAVLPLDPPLDPPLEPALPRRLSALGPLRMGDLWESTAVPELRVQARDLAARLLRTLPRT
jgi:uncharacterized NAD(P)/FAD-binding protein YdhS